MPVATGTALLISALASGAASTAGAKIASSGAKSAAKTQQAASDRAAAMLERNKAEARDVYGQNLNAQTAAFRPYAQLGLDSMANMYRGMGYGAMPAQSLPPQQGGGYGAPPVSGAPIGFRPNVTAPGSRPPGAVSAGPVGRAQMPSLGGTYQDLGGNTGQVMLRAPDGDIRAVPAGAAQALIARGATRVG